jgi:hypothetical protein
MLAATSRPPCTTGDGGGAVLESRRERRVRVGARERSGGGRRFVDDEGGGEAGVAAVEARRSAAGGGLEAEGVDAVRLGDTLGRVVEVVEERGLCEVPMPPPAVNLLVLGVSRETTYGPVGEAGISTLLRKE